MPLSEIVEMLQTSENASMSDTKSSSQPLKSQESDFVYDFLYHDARRVASFLAQFQKYGNLKEVKAVAEAESKGDTTTEGSLSGSVPAVIKAEGTVKEEKEKKITDRLESTYDPLWAGARKFLDYLQSANILVREAESARIGQFVLVTGKLAVFDLKFMSKLFDNKAITKPIIDGLVRGVDKAAGATPQQHKDTVISLFDFVKSLPHVVQMGIKTPKNYFWGVLSEEYMVTSATDILLKSGGDLSGDWTVIGILDSFPTDEKNKEDSAMQNLGTMASMAFHFVPQIRSAVGRPDAAYGITPVLILREVSGLDT